MAEEKITDNTYSITRNVIQSGNVMGVPIRNVVEGVTFGIIGLGIVCSINFTATVKSIVAFVVFFSLFVFGIKGIKNRSITQIVIAEIRFRKRRRKLHLRSADYVREKNNYKNMESADTSIAQKKWGELKSSLITFARENSEEDSI